MPSADPFFGARKKIERAETHIANLEATLVAFNKTEPYGFFTEDGPEPGQTLFKIRIKNEIPIEAILLIGESLQSLKSSLDYTVHELVLANGGTITVRTGFPIYKGSSPTEYEAMRKPKVKGMRQDAIDYIDGLKPYQGGNDPIWRINELNNREKHRLLMTAGIGYRHGQADIGPPPEIAKAFSADVLKKLGGICLTLRPTDAVFPLEDGAVFFIFQDHTPPYTKPHMNFKFTFGVAFNEPGIVQGEPVIELLHQSVGLVKGIVSDLSKYL